MPLLPTESSTPLPPSPGQSRAEPKKQEKLQRQSRYIAGLLGALNVLACLAGSHAPTILCCG